MKESDSKIYIDKVKAVSDTIQALRGSVIGWGSDIENELTNIVTWCFYPAEYISEESTDELINEDGIIFKSIILRKIDFSDKINFLKDIIIAKAPQIWKSHPAFINRLIKHLHNVREFRNIIAHSSSDLSASYLSSIELPNYSKNKEVQVIEYSKGKVIKHRFDTTKIVCEIFKCVRTSTELSQLFAMINGDQIRYEEYEPFVCYFNDTINSIESKKK